MKMKRGTKIGWLLVALSVVLSVWVLIGSNSRANASDYTVEGGILTHYNGAGGDVNDIPSEVLDTLESYGFPRDIYNQLMDGTADEDSPLAEWYDSLEDALVNAYTQGEENGSASAAENDFNNAFRNSMPEGVQWIEQDSTESVRPLVVSKAFVENCLEGIWGYLDTYSEDMYSSFVEYLKQTIGDNLAENFKEPYYGWQDFDGDSFADRLLDEILELDIPEQSAVDLELDEPEKSLLNFDGETGEYREELDLDTDIQVEKPKKLFYKYKDYNKEISSKSYRLNYIMVSELLEFLRNPENRRYVDTWDLRDLEEYGISPDDAQYVILSKIKPSYLPTYGQHGWTIWIDNGDYDLNYIGWIPKEVGDSILHDITEDLELDVSLVPEIDIDELHYFDGIEDLIAGKCNEPLWGVKIIDFGREDVEYEVQHQTLSKALERFNEMRKSEIDGDAIVVLFFCDDESEERYRIGGLFDSDDEIDVASFDEDDRLKEDLEPELHYYNVWWCDENDLDDGEMFRTPIITKQTTNAKPTPADVMAMYSEDDTWQGNPGYVIVDVDEITKEEFEDYFALPADYTVFDLTKYDSVELKEEEALPDYIYYECYMEPADETTWNPDKFEWDGEPSYKNASAVIKVHESQQEPTPAEAEIFLDSVGLLPEGFTVLYLSELSDDDEWVQEADDIPEFLPKDNSVDIE